MDINNIKLLDVIDRHTLQALQDVFSDATGMAALATDDTGAVTNGSNFTDFCMNLTRKSRVGCERCNQCDLHGGEQASKTGRPAVYYCHGGLMDFAAPIMLNGKHIGTLVGGQVLPEEPDEEKFRKIAVELNIDPDKYIEALRKVKIVPKAQIESAANLLYQMANALSEVGYQKLLLQESSATNEEVLVSVNSEFSKIHSEMASTADAVKALSENFDKIKTAVATSEKAVVNTDGIVKAIESASTNLTLLGFNASIEAKRAGAAGVGFNVIATEVRSLANKNTKNASEISDMLLAIKKSMTEINTQIKTMYSNIEKNAENITNLNDMLNDVNELLEKINK